MNRRAVRAKVSHIQIEQNLHLFQVQIMGEVYEQTITFKGRPLPISMNNRLAKYVYWYNEYQIRMLQLLNLDEPSPRLVRVLWKAINNVNRKRIALLGQIGRRNRSDEVKFVRRMMHAYKQRMLTWYIHTFSLNTNTFITQRQLERFNAANARYIALVDRGY